MIDARQSATAHPTRDELLLFQTAYQTRCCGLTGMQTRVTDGTSSSRPWCKGSTAILGRVIARRRNFLINADGACRKLTLFRQDDFLLTAAALKEQVMSRKPYSLSKQLVVATALALGAS